MLSLAIYGDLFDHESEVDLVTRIKIPLLWSEVEGVWLLRSLDYDEDAVFNHHLIGDLLGEVDVWEQFEADRGDPDGRLETIDQVRRALSGALERRDYAVFLGA